MTRRLASAIVLGTTGAVVALGVLTSPSAPSRALARLRTSDGAIHLPIALDRAQPATAAATDTPVPDATTVPSATEEASATPLPPMPDLVPGKQLLFSLQWPWDCYPPTWVWGIEAVIDNLGDGDAGPFEIEVGGVRHMVPGLQARKSLRLFVPGAGMDSQGLANAAADVADEVAESREDNNVTTPGRVPEPTLPFDDPCTATPGPSPTASPTPIVTGAVSFELADAPMSCGPIQVNGVFTASSDVAPVTRMRHALVAGPFTTSDQCLGVASKLTESPVAFESRRSYALTGGPRLYRAALAAVFVDAIGNESPLYCAPLRVVCAPTPTPAAFAVSASAPTWRRRR